MTALYEAEVSHTRRERIDRAFSHKVYLWLVDLDRLPTLPRWLRPFARFEARDHFGPHADTPVQRNRTIRENLDRWLAERGVDLQGGRVLMLANARLLGHVFNPLSVYWCHRPDGTLACVVAEVHNTYGERHPYLLETDGAGRAQVDKAFYVSPFLDMGGRYLMRLPEPDDELSVTIALRQNGKTPFTAGLHGVRRAVTPANLARLLVTRPLMTLRVSTLIRIHGITLWLRRLPITPRSNR